MDEKSKIIEQIARQRLVERYISGFHPDQELKNELAQETYLALLEYREGVIEKVYQQGMLKFLVFKIAKNLLFSSTSTFYHKYLKYENNRRPIELCENSPRRDLL